MNNVDFWNNFIEAISQKTNPVSFSTWFTNINLLEIFNNKIIVEVPMPMHKKILGDTYYSLIEDTLFSLTGINYDVEFVLEEQINNENQSLIEINKNDLKQFESNLLADYTFETFIEGESNKLAKHTALEVAKQPGQKYNPFFIYGKSGLGKTHLMHAVGNYIIDNSNKKVLYTTSDNFMTEFVGISKEQNNIDYAELFKSKYRDVDVLIIDDIQYLVGAEKTQQEFFHTFNSLHQANKQIIISSDRSPDDLKKIEERLRSRFTGGLKVNIFPPDFDLRCKIIKNKINKKEISTLIKDGVIEFIANSCENDVRYLEGAITRLEAYTAINLPKKIDIEFANIALKDFVSKPIYNSNTIDDIQNAVANYYGLKIEDLKNKKRSANIVHARHIAMYLCRILTEESYPRIGLEFGGRDHSTVIHACEKMQNDLKNNNQLKEIIDEIKNKI